jgi:sugar/nucleoside kinase (ribokinase family)
MNQIRYDAVVVGNVGVDTNVYLQGDEIDFSVEANFTENVDYVGQAGGYAARGFAQLGRRTAFVGYVGEDHNGLLVRQAFARDRIDTTALFVDPAGTCRSVNVVSRDGRRKNFYDGRSHMTLEPPLEVCRDVLSRARLVHFNIPNWARRLLPVARACGAVVSCDIQDPASADDPYRRDFVEHADVIFVSATNFPEPEPLVASLLARQPEAIVVAGLGARGCALGARGAIRRFAAIETGAPVVDTNGAGDALAVGFLTSWALDGYDLETSILRGQIAARHTCSIKASSDGLITPSELDSRHQRRSR